jgi:two-component system, cell cycle sensor histidine kinase and response regulator CckA
VARDGRKVTVDSRWTLVRSPDGTPRSVLIIDTDITAKKQLEEQFLRAQRLEIIGTLAGGVAHDLNNMLGPILNSAQLLRHSVTEERGHKWLAIMESNARRGADLVRQVLTFARGLGTERGLLQLKHLVREIDRMMQETFPASVVTVVELPKDPWLVWGDATQVHQVLLNLCVNARDAMPDGGKLTVSVSNVEFQEPTAFGEDELPPGRYVELAVRDTGTGMPAEVQQKIFDPFFTTKEPGKGTGLGLATVANIVKHHEGVIALESEPGKGTVFKIYLPAADLAELPESKTLTKEALTGHGEWILLIDDESSIREITRATLENYGYRVLSAAQGKEATTLFLQRRKDIAVVVADLLMPVMDGPATMQLFRRIDPDIKLLAISGNQSREEFAQLEGMANIPLLAKPFDSEDLLAAIRALIDKDKSPPPADSP